MHSNRLTNPHKCVQPETCTRIYESECAARTQQLFYQKRLSSIIHFTHMSKYLLSANKESLGRTRASPSMIYRNSVVIVSIVLAHFMALTVCHAMPHATQYYAFFAAFFIGQCTLNYRQLRFRRALYCTTITLLCWLLSAWHKKKKKEERRKKQYEHECTKTEIH